MELVTHTHLQMEYCLHEADVLCCTCRKTSKLNQQGRRGDHHTTLISHLSSPHRTAASQAERLLRGIGALDRTKGGSSARFIAEPLSMILMFLPILRCTPLPRAWLLEQERYVLCSTPASKPLAATAFTPNF